MKDALDFYKTCLLPAYRDWINDRIREHNIRQVIGALNDMAEWIYKTVPSEKALFCSESAYRDHIANVFPVYAIIRDIANGTKHVSLKPEKRAKKRRRITHADQVKEITFPNFDAVRDVDALSDWNGLREWGVTDDDGKWTALTPAIEQMKAFWENKLTNAGFRLPSYEYTLISVVAGDRVCHYIICRTRISVRI